MSAPDEPKLIIDSDWKAQAQAEKQRLAAKQAPKPAAGQPSAQPGTPTPASSLKAGAPIGSTAADPAGQSGAAEPGTPGADKVRFGDLVSMLASQALLYMGAYPDPKTGQAMVSLEYAKLHIDLLGVLQEKTKGNLDEAERKMLERVTHELRVEFVELARELEKAMREGRLQRGGPGGAGPGGVVTAGPGSLPDFPPIQPR